jgi:hypothetical protein
LQYTAAGVDESQVKSRAEEMMEAEMVKMRFALPYAAPDVRLGLRRVFAKKEYWRIEDWMRVGDFGIDKEKYIHM